MTDYEMRQMANMIAEGLAERMMTDDELLERIFPSKPMSIDEASQWSGIPVGTIYQKADEIPHSKVGKRLVFTERGLSGWIKANTARRSRTEIVGPLSLRVVANG